MTAGRLPRGEELRHAARFRAIIAGTPSRILASANFGLWSDILSPRSGRQGVCGPRLSAGRSFADLLEAYPTLTEDDLRAALAFAADYMQHETVLAAE